MEIPAASFIEMARDQVKSLDPDTKYEQLRELEEATGNQLAVFQDGYLLGLQTARVLLATMPKAVQAGVEL